MAPVLRKFAVIQLNVGPFVANENETDTQSKAYRALKALGGKAPAGCLETRLADETKSGRTLYKEAYPRYHETE